VKVVGVFCVAFFHAASLAERSKFPRQNLVILAKRKNLISKMKQFEVKIKAHVTKELEHLSIPTNQKIICLCHFEKETNNYLNDYFKEKAIQVMCWDSKTEAKFISI
jgi:hypothetical protein